MDVRHIVIPVSFLFFCTCLSSCSRGISTRTSRPTEEFSQSSAESDLPAYLFNKPMIAVFQTRFASYDDLFRPGITFAIWDNGTFLLKENQNYVTGALSVQSLSDVNHIINNETYHSCLTEPLPEYPHSDYYHTILSIENKEYAAESSLRLTSADDLDDMRDFLKFDNSSSLPSIRKTNDTIYQHLKKSTASATALSLSEVNVMQIISKWGHGPPYLSQEEIKRITSQPGPSLLPRNTDEKN